MAVLFDSAQQRAVNSVRDEALQGLEEAERLFLEKFCEEMDGTTFDCRVLDQFERAKKTIRILFDYELIRDDSMFRRQAPK